MSPGRPLERPDSRRRRLGRGALAGLVVVAAFVFGLPRFASLTDVWHAVGHVTWRAGVVVAATAMWNLVTYWLLWMAAVPGLGFRQAALVTTAPTALANTVPGGSYASIALTYSILRSFGHDGAATTTAMVVTGLWNNFAKLVVPLVALVALALDGNVEPPRVLAAGFGLALLAVTVAGVTGIVRSAPAAATAARLASTAARPVLRLLCRPPPTDWGGKLDRLRRQTASIVTQRWHWITVSAVTSHLSLSAVLLASLRAAGVDGASVSAAEVLAVFAFARLVTALPMTPGGVGVVELALTAALVTAGGDRPAVVADVLVYRALTYLLPIPLGAVAYLVWRRDVRAKQPIRSAV